VVLRGTEVTIFEMVGKAVEEGPMSVKWLPGTVSCSA